MYDGLILLIQQPTSDESPIHSQLEALQQQHATQQQILAREFHRLRREMVLRQRQELEFHIQVYYTLPGIGYEC